MKQACDKNNVFNVFVDITSETRFIVAGIIDGILEKADLDGFSKYLNTPDWYKEIKKLRKKVKNNYNPVAAGQVIVKALNANAPAVVLLNDLHKLKHDIDLENFVRVLQEIIDHSKPGILVMVSSRINFYKKFFKKYKSLHERINSNIVIPKLKEEEANLLIAKRMLEKRMVDDLEPLFPYTEDTVKVLNEQAKGNPRDLLKLSSFILDQAADSRTMTINDEFTREQFNIGLNKSLDDIFDEDIEKPAPKGELSHPQIKQKLTKKYDESKIQKIGGSISNNPSSNKTEGGNSGISKMVKEDSEYNYDNNGHKDMQQIKVRCPKCSRIFVFSIEEEKEKMKCPNPKCDFIGEITKQ